MATEGIHTPPRPKPVAIAPAPLNMETNLLAGPAPVPMAHSCRTCAIRKVKCDKVAPTCSSCHKSKLDCLYQPVQPRQRKRKLSGDVNTAVKLVRYERILQQLGVLEPDPDRPPSPASTSTATGSNKDAVVPLRVIPWGHSQRTKVGKLLVVGRGASRYIDSDLWGDLDDNDQEYDHPISDDEREPDFVNTSRAFADPLTEAFMAYGCAEQDLIRHHPTHVDAMVMWQVHATNVEPLYKVLHIPSVASMVETISKSPKTASKADDCLLFAIYHFAVFSMSEQECMEKLGQPSVSLRQRYHSAARQALVRASFLKTTDMTVLQALVLFLLACRQYYDPHTFWILTGVAVRIAQRIGLHRDGERLGLAPFQVQMRRRLFYQLMPLDATASQMSGIGIMMPPDNWDTQPAFNVNDDQLWPAMTEPPQEQQKGGATDMMFCLSRFCIGKSMRQFKDDSEADKAIDEAEKEVEEKYIRYCDVIDPLHFLAAGVARSGITAMRLRVRLPRARAPSATDDERREAIRLAQKILDTDSASHEHPGLSKRFGWYISHFFLWGMWDSLVYILSTLSSMRPGLLSENEMQTAWDKIERVYRFYGELLDTKRALNVAFQRLTIKAWNATHGDVADAVDADVPGFIKTLHSLRSRGKEVATATEAAAVAVAGPTLQDQSPEGTFSLGSSFETTATEFEFNSDDWTLWEQLIESDRVNPENGGL
ncbi:Fungal specific transcription factor domain containing protein [Rhypophila decipiens]